MGIVQFELCDRDRNDAVVLHSKSSRMDRIFVSWYLWISYSTICLVKHKKRKSLVEIHRNIKNFQKGEKQYQPFSSILDALYVTIQDNGSYLPHSLLLELVG